VDLAEIFDAGASEAEYADTLTERLAARLAPAEIGLLIASNQDRLAVVATCSQHVGELASLQIRLDEGPVLDCHRNGQAVLNESTATANERWPQFAPAARTGGFGVVSALPMRRRGQSVGVIFAAAGEYRLAQEDVHNISVLARVAAVAIAQQRDLRRSVLAAEQLQRALDSRVLIEQAKGAVAARLGISPGAAFELLRAYARQGNLTLVEVASRTIPNNLTPHDLMAAYEARRNGEAYAGRVAHS